MRLSTTTVLLFAAVLSSVAKSSAADNYAVVDGMLHSVQSRIDKALYTVVIDHSRLAREAGEDLSPSTLLIFSDAAVNTPILRSNPLAGLDLPYRVLFYQNPDGTNAYITSDAGYIGRRHDMAESAALARYSSQLEDAIRGLDPGLRHAVDVRGVSSRYGIRRYRSAYDFDTTLDRFKSEVLENNDDTLWFGEIDYTADAAKLGVQLPRMKLLMFGAPAPGAKAMADFKTLGLDAFCQKVLVLEQQGVVSLYSNDIVDLARLHYDDTIVPHRVINFRLDRAYSRVTE